jgi:(1->4)-alpha-D-glucan 1-alpha-D-glucosylmutase
MHKLLDFRRAHQELFAEGEYIPLEVAGESRSAVCAFARRRDGAWAVAVAPRGVAGAVYRGSAPGGGELRNSTAVSFRAEMPGEWLNLLTGERLEIVESGSSRTLSLSRLFNNFPVALLYQGEASSKPKMLEENLHAAGIQHTA